MLVNSVSSSEVDEDWAIKLREGKQERLFGKDIILAGVVIAMTGSNIGGIAGEQEEFDWDEFSLGFTSFSFQLRFDGLVLVFILPLIVGLFIAARHGIEHADSILVLIGGMLFIAPIVTGFTELTNQPYRFVPLVVFFAIGVGVLLSKRQVSQS